MTFSFAYVSTISTSLISQQVAATLRHVSNLTDLPMNPGSFTAFTFGW